MNAEFETRLHNLKEQYHVLTPDKKREIKREMLLHRPRTYRKCEHLRHELLRLELKRNQVLAADQPEKNHELEEKILMKKAQLLKILYENKK
ncbi:AAA family ATPase [Enterococcus hirae]|jgi:hypothetical protein|nr:AAA family ATPase [Enterococcaceae bacterium]MDM8214208.1 AAA family ATPase [Enterococcus hirae]